MRNYITIIVLCAITTFSFWAGETGRGWVAFPVGCLIAIVVLVNDAVHDKARCTNDE